MYLEIVECLNDVNKSIHGLTAIVVFIAANVAEIIDLIYCQVLFPREYETLLVYPLASSLTCATKVLILYMIGHSTEKEINRMSLIKFFLLRRLHEHFHFQLYGMCHINLRQLLILTNSAIGYLSIQILFKLNK
ncbi:unnamed protein product [Macrosiphum euphorbiae]|nr:unnamed protein product [Macrosiphum euphorbiae]